MTGLTTHLTNFRRGAALWAVLLAGCLWLTGTASAQTAVQSGSGYQDMTVLGQWVADFSGDGYRPHLDKRLRLAACGSAPELLWYGARQTTVLVRCGGPRSWQIYVPVSISHDVPPATGGSAGSGGGGMVVVSRPVPRGAPLTAADLKIQPQSTMTGVATSIDQVVGRIAVRALNPGEAVRATLIAEAPLIKRGDPIQIKAGGGGMEVSVAGIADEDGSKGSRIRVRNSESGRRIQAVVAAPGIVVLPGYKIPGNGRE